MFYYTIVYELCKVPYVVVSIREFIEAHKRLYRESSSDMSEKIVDLPTPSRGRGRPKGTGGNKRPDKSRDMSVQTEPGDNRKYLEHWLKMWDWPSVDMKQREQVKERIGMYFKLCADDDMKPSVAGLALAFGVHRKTIWAWSTGVDSKTLPTESRDFIKKAYQILNAQMEDYAQNGKINPVAAIFLMKNHFGYQDKQEVVLTPNNQLGEAASAEELQQKYIEAAASDYDSEE